MAILESALQRTAQGLVPACAVSRACHTLLALAVGVACIPAVKAAQTLTLDEAINTALTNNPALKQFQLTSQSAHLGIDSARTAFQLSAQPLGGVTVDNDGESSGFYGLRLAKRTGLGGEITVSGVDNSLLEDSGSTRYTVSFSQALFRNAGALINRENIVRAKQSHLTAQRALELTKARTVVSVADAFEQVVRLERQLTADEQALARAASLLKLTRAKERLGRTTRIDTLRVQLQQGETVSRATNTREQLKSSKRALAELMGWNSAVLPPLEPAPLFTVDYKDLDEATATAFANRLDLAQTQQAHDDALRASRIAKKGLQPNLRLVAQYDHNDSDNAGFQNAFDSGFDQPIATNTNNSINRNTWTVSLVSDTDFNRNREKLEYRQALLQQGRTVEDIRAAHLAIGRDVELALLAYERSHKELSVLQGNLQHAQARLTLARKLFRVGRSDGFSVTDAEQAYFSAQSRWLSGRSEASVNGYRLLEATGTLVESPAHLKPGAG